MGSLQELGWQKKVRTRSCGEFNHSNSTFRRRQSAPSLILSKALTKSKPVYRDCTSQVNLDPHGLIQSLLGPSRKLISQGNVLLQTGVQTQERYLLLFTDLLIITKAKYGELRLGIVLGMQSVMQVKQKACVRVSEMWTASCVDEVCEANAITERSFVMGWPTYNCVATFSTSEGKERWLSLIESCIKEEKKRDDPNIIPLEIFAKDVGNCNYAKTVSVSNTDCASDVIVTVMKQLYLSGGIKDYQLWVCSKKDETPYPLIGKIEYSDHTLDKVGPYNPETRSIYRIPHISSGHEFPYSIQMSHMRSLQKNAVTVSHRQEVTIDSFCQFFLRPRQINCTIAGEQKGRKRKKSLISWAFKRGFSIEQDVFSESLASSGHIITSSSGHLFGRPLTDVIKDNTLPSPIVDMLMCLCSEGAMTHGIFRRCAGVKACRELREQLDAGHHERPLNEESVFVTAAVFKDFLRNIPGSLLCEELYELWLRAMEKNGERDKLMMERKQLLEVQRLLQLLPKENLILLTHVIAMLHHIHLNAEHNQMNSFNLAVCIAPSCLWNSSPQSQEEDAKKVCDLVHFLIDNCCALFGDAIITLLKNLTEDKRSNYGSAGSLHQPSDSGYDSLKNEVNTDTEDILKSVPLKDSRSMDSLISVSDCDLDCPDDELETDSSHSMVQIRKVTPAVCQPRSDKQQRHSVYVTGCALKSDEQDERLESRKCHKVEMSETKVNNNVLLERSFQQLKLVCEKDGVNHSKKEKLGSPPLSLSVNSIESGFSQSSDYLRSLKIFQSPQNCPPKSYWVRRHSADYQQPISLLNENLHPLHHQAYSVLSQDGLQHKTSQSRPKSPPSYRHALLNLNRKAVAKTLTQMQSRGEPRKEKSLFCRNTQSPLEDHQACPAPQIISNTSSNSKTGAGRDSTCIKSRTEEKVILPERMYYGQSRKLTVHRVRGQNLNAGSNAGNLTGQQRTFKGSDALKVRSEVTEKQANGRSRRLRRCISSQWVGELGFHSEESYV